MRLVLAVAAGMTERPIYQAVVDKFVREHPEIQVELLEIPGNYYQKLTIMMAGRNAPDLMWMGSGFAQFAQRDAFLDLSDRISRDVDLCDLHPEAVRWYRFNNKQYGIPFGIDLYFIAYNKDLFDRYHVSYPQRGWTFDDFLEKAKKLTADDNGDGRIDHYGFRGEFDVSLFNACYISPDGQHPLCTSPAVLDYLQVNLDLAQRYHVSPPATQLPNFVVDDPVSVFRQGGVAMMVLATWDLPLLRERCQDMEWDVITNPTIRRKAHWASSQAILVSRDTKHPNEAWALCRRFLADDFQRAMSDRVVPVSRRVAALVATENTVKPHNLAALVEATDSMYRPPSFPSMFEYGQFWLDARIRVFSGRATPAQAMASLERELQQLIKDRRRLSDN